MLPAFVISLREGIEGALIVGILAAFAIAAGRRDALRAMWAGVSLAVVLCLAAGVGLNLLDGELPERQQQALEIVIALVAAGAVTYMIVWMRRHAAGMRARLETSAAKAIGRGSVWALVGMAFAAVMREGLETAVFLVAAFQQSSSPRATGTGAVLGLLAAVVLGYAIYRGGARIDLARFFRATGAVLVLVAAGLVAFAAHTAQEAGWLSGLQGEVVDLSAVVAPGSVRAALLTGVLGVQPVPTFAEAAVWLLYLVPMALFVLWPTHRRRPAVPRRAAEAAAS